MKLASFLYVTITTLLLTFFKNANAENTTDSSSVASTSINDGDSAWMLTSAALVVLMTPGLAFFYGGLVRHKNVINTLMMNFACMGFISVLWVFYGYSFAFGPGNQGWGSFEWGGLRYVGVTPNADYGATVPHINYCLFQLGFAIITPALISGAVAERMRFGPFVIFVCLWNLFVYVPLIRWVWAAYTPPGGVVGVDTIYGVIRGWGVLDFAGGHIHISSGFAGLVAALIIGERNHKSEAKHAVGDNVPYTILGAGILWFGWFGFNAGSAYAANGIAGLAFANTHISAAAGLCMFMILDWIFYRKTTATGAASGAVVGLVVITPASGFVYPGYSVIIGMVGALFSYLAIIAKKKLDSSFDDTLDVFCCHGVGGLMGTVLTGLFATKEVNSAGLDGAFYGNPVLLGWQIAGALMAVVLSCFVTAGLLLAMKYIFRINLRTEDEVDGMDVKFHGETYMHKVEVQENVKKSDEQKSQSIALEMEDAVANKEDDHSVPEND